MTMKMTPLASAFLTVALSLPTLALADQDYGRDTGGGPAHNFGQASNLVISSDAAMSVSHRTGNVTNVTLAPALDYFVVPNLSIGGFVGFDYTNADNSSATRFGIGPRVGYNLILGDLVSVWPKVGFAYTHSSITVTSDLGNNVTSEVGHESDSIALNLFVPIVFHPVQHFFAGFGPFLDTDLSGDNKVTVFGLKLTLGGWI